jgi:flagellar basal body rod protein FlgC
VQKRHARRKLPIARQFVYHLLGFYWENGVDIRQPKWLEPPGGNAWLGHRHMKNNFSLRGRWLWLCLPYLAHNALPDEVRADPYQCKAITFESTTARLAELETVRVTNIDVDRSELRLRYDRANLIAVQQRCEVTNMREAERAYSASLSVIQTARGTPYEAIGLPR